MRYRYGYRVLTELPLIFRYMTMPAISVLDYDPLWPKVFEQLRASVCEVLGPVAVAVEHVGSTAVPGLAAKPIIDMSIVVAHQTDVAIAISRLATLGYQHLGDLGIEGREAFENPPGRPAHHLYVCPQGSLGLRNHLLVRDFLRNHPDVAAMYGALKKKLARQYTDDLESYVDGKTDFIVGILENSELTDDELESISKANRKA